jgi:hypothetical protein
MKLKDRMLRAGPIWKRIIKRSDTFFRNTIIAGGAAGDHTVTGIKKGDKLVSVLHVDFTDASETGNDITTEFGGNGKIIEKDDTINNTGGTATTGGFLLVAWEAYDER